MLHIDPHELKARAIAMSLGVTSSGTELMTNEVAAPEPMMITAPAAGSARSLGFKFHTLGTRNQMRAAQPTTAIICAASLVRLSHKSRSVAAVAGRAEAG